MALRLLTSPLVSCYYLIHATEKHILITPSFVSSECLTNLCDETFKIFRDSRQSAYTIVKIMVSIVEIVNSHSGKVCI
jgi:hypothetical protein